MTPLVLDVNAAAKMIGVSPWVLRHYIDMGLLPTVRYPSAKRPGKPNRRVLIAVRDLAEFVERHREAGK